MTSTTPDAFHRISGPARRVEWTRLGLFVAGGTTLFLLAVVGAAFVPLGWPDSIRRSAHPTIFVPLAFVLTFRMLRRDARELGSSALFDPRPMSRATAFWLLFGGVIAGFVALTFVLLFGLRWAPNLRWSAPRLLGMLWAIALTAAAEEIAFRGYAFWRLTRIAGFWPAQAVVAALFAVSHLTLGGYKLLPALVGNVTGSVLYGVAFVRARGIAAPIALHSGWNIVQHLLLSPLDPSATPVVPTFPHTPTGGEYAAMLAIIGIVMAVATVGVLARNRAP